MLKITCRRQKEKACVGKRLSMGRCFLGEELRGREWSGTRDGVIKFIFWKEPSVARAGIAEWYGEEGGVGSERRLWHEAREERRAMWGRLGSGSSRSGNQHGLGAAWMAGRGGEGISRPAPRVQTVMAGWQGAITEAGRRRRSRLEGGICGCRRPWCMTCAVI